MDFATFDTEYNKGVERGCGVREPGGIYAVTLLGPNGRPLNEFLFDPPISLGDLAIAPRGVTILERPDGSGVFDVYDWVGENGYPNVADMVEEIRRFGMSRRLGKSLDFSLLTPASLHFLIHPRAIITNAEDFYDVLEIEWRDYGNAHPFTCMCDRKAHASYPYVDADYNTRETCASLWYDDVTKGEVSYDPADYPRTVTRKSGSTTYTARHAPHDFTPTYAPGIFVRLPIHRLEVVAGDDGEDDAAHIRLDGTTTLPVVDVDY